MPYRDSWATCEKCGKQFIFRVEEQRWLDKMGFEIKPTFCPEHRDEREPEAAVQPKAAEQPEPDVQLEAGQQQGVVKWYEPKKRYGFITMRSGDDIFFHRNAIIEGDEQDFIEGAKVTFEVTESDKGPEATNVAII